MAEPHESRVYSDFAHLYDSVFGRAFVDREHELIESLTFRPGGGVVLISHFASPKRWLYVLGKAVTPLTKLLGWTSRLRWSDVHMGQKIKVERFERFSALSVHFAVVVRKEA